MIKIFRIALRSCGSVVLSHHTPKFIQIFDQRFLLKYLHSVIKTEGVLYARRLSRNVKNHCGFIWGLQDFIS